MKIALFSPYLDTAGGGEKYMMTLAEILSVGHQVFVLLDTHLYSLGISNIKSKIESMHNIDLSSVNFIKAPIGKGSFFLSRLFFLRQFDFLFYLTDGSIFYSTAKNNIIHFQVPFENLSGKNIWGRLKLSSWRLAICNSKFTQNIIKNEWLLESEIIYPPVSVQLFKPLKKKKMILSVGRFFPHLKTKKHEVLIKAFKNVNKEKLKGWSLHIAGSVSEQDLKYVNELEKESEGYPVYLYPNVSLSGLQKLYGESSIYWHAAGFEESDPKNMEHFGISVVEAMSAGCVPVVINKGGLTEIVIHRENGFLWDSLEQLQTFTIDLAQDEYLRERMSKKAQTQANEFTKEIFIKKIHRLVNMNE